MKKKLLLFLLGMLLIPSIVYASSDSASSDISIFFFAPFISIFHLVFIVLPIKTIGFNFTYNLNKNSLTEYLIILVLNVVAYECIGDLYFVLGILIIFLVGFPVIFFAPLFSKYVTSSKLSEFVVDPSKTIDGCVDGLLIRCTKCNCVMKPSDKFCGGCGAEFSGDNASVEKVDEKDLAIKATQYDPIYNKSEEQIIREIIRCEMTALDLKDDNKMIASGEKNRVIILNIIFCVLLFLFIGLIFYHVNLYIYIIGLIILFQFFKAKNKFDLESYIYKEVKARPNENIDNIIGSIKENMIPKNNVIYSVVLPIIVIIACVIIFRNPIIFYEPIDGGYAMRYYFTGWSSLTHASIPEEHNGKPVVSLRGNAFSNMIFLKEVYLPNTITEIRGSAFINDYNLEKVHIPEQLKYLGGDSFKNCKKLKKVNFTYDMPLEEIRGNTFENCYSLSEITIPDSVTRIGGHAFYGNKSLSNVNISENSKLNEIGSSAFRQCKSLYSINLPASASVNSKAFKESPTKIYKFGELTESEPVYLGILFEGSNKSFSLPKYGELTIRYEKYISSSGKRNFVLSGFINDSIAFESDFDLKIKYNDKISFRPSYSSSAVYIYYSID